MGAEPLIYGEGFITAVRALVPDGVDAVADFHGEALESTLVVLKESGSHASIADGTVGAQGGHYIWVRPEGKEFQCLDALVVQGKLGVHMVDSYPKQQAAAAFTQSMNGNAGGKIVLTEFTG